ncbi:hypothetical protein [Streptomyces sp. NPDC057682]|uniref:hypothetical protein n=1 Tax=Streptomyces sp. NPDC057682 TaxID=3346210 RepID=UPI00368883C5
MIRYGPPTQPGTEAIPPPTSDPVGDSYTPIGPRFAPVDKSLQFIAGEDHFTLEFAGRAPGGCGPLITDVVVKAIDYVRS